MLKYYKNIDNPSKPPLERGGLVASLRVQKSSGFPSYAVLCKEKKSDYIYNLFDLLNKIIYLC